MAKKRSVTRHRRKMNALGSALKAARATRGIRLLDLADNLGISVPFLSDVENGRRNLSDDRIIAAARYLKIDVEALLRLAIQDRGCVTLDVQSVDPKMFEIAFKLSRYWPNIPDDLRQTLHTELGHI